MDRSDEDNDLRVLEDTEPVLERAPQYSPTVVIGSASSSLEILSKVPDTRSSSEEFDKGTGMPALGVDWSDDGCEMFPGPPQQDPGWLRERKVSLNGSFGVERGLDAKKLLRQCDL